MTDVLYLSSADVHRLLPPLGEQVALAEQAISWMADPGLQLPPKPAIVPRENGFIHAMPTYVPGPDIAALKWIGGSAANPERGMPYLSGLIVLNDTESMVPLAIMDAAEITASRTAAMTALCVTRFGPPNWERVAIVGFGVQGRAHARLLRALYPDVDVDVVVRNGAQDGLLNDVGVVSDARIAVRTADIVVTSMRMGRPAEPFLTNDLMPVSRLFLPVDFDATLDASVPSDADSFIVDDIETFEHYRHEGYFAGWPDPHLSLAQALASPPPGARLVCCNLGVATLDAAFAQHVLQRARDQGVGLWLR